MSRTVLPIRDLKIAFPTGVAVDGVDLTVDQGDVVALVGESGSGVWSGAAGASRGGLSHGVGDRRTLHNSCDSPTRCATACEGCDANGDPLVGRTGGETTPGPPDAPRAPRQKPRLCRSPFALLGRCFRRVWKRVSARHAVRRSGKTMR